MTAVLLYRVDPSRNMRRFYRLDVQPDLFGFWLLVREWGRMSIDWLCAVHPNLVAPDDPRESLMRFQVLRQSFFDYPALVMHDITDGEAHVIIAYGMGHTAEEAASFQTLGFFQRLLEVSGAKDVTIGFSSTTWEGGPNTLLAMQWT